MKQRSSRRTRRPASGPGKLLRGRAVRPEIWISDLVAAVDRLGIEDEHTLDYALRALGIEAVSPPAEATEPETIVEDDDERETEVDSPDRELPPLAADRSEPFDEPPELRPVATESWAEEPELEGRKLLEPVTERHRQARPPHLPLFEPLATRPLLSGALATDGPGGVIDVERLVSLVARARPVTEIPHRPRPSLLRGVRVLVDNGPGMELFQRDQEELVAQLKDLVGREQVEVEWFEGSPLRGCGPGSLASWTSFSPPHPGTPVLVLGDLGIGEGRADVVDEWLELSDLLRVRGSRLVAFVPYPNGRWPPALDGALHLVTWDRRTGISDIGFRLRR